MKVENSLFKNKIIYFLFFILFAFSCTNEKTVNDNSVIIEDSIKTKCYNILLKELKNNNEDDFWISIHAAEALTLAGKSDIVKSELEKKLITQKDARKICGIAREFVRAGDKSKVKLIVDILKNPKSSYAHIHACESLFKVNVIGSEKLLLKAMNQNEDINKKLFAAAALGRHGNLEAMKIIRENLNSDKPGFSSRAAWILARIGDSSDISDLKKALVKFKNDKSVYEFENALAMLGDKNGLKYLEKNLQSQRPEIREESATFAGEIRAFYLKDKLVNLLNDPNVGVKVRAAQALLLLSLEVFKQNNNLINIGNRLELFVDNYLIDKMTGNAELRLHKPIRREIVFNGNEPWEGNSCGYFTVFQDGDIYRMYYRGGEQKLKGEKKAHKSVTCYADSKDGIHWAKPQLNLFEFNGSKKNNIIWKGGVHNFTPFIDTNPSCPANEKYKALGSVNKNENASVLMAFKSSDGIHWSLLSDKPIMDEKEGEFDSQNLAFWDSVNKEYKLYFRKYRELPGNIYGIRDIKTSVSKDFKKWSKPVFLKYPAAPQEQLYTNQIIPYFRAPHILLGFPTRYVDRGWVYSTEHLPMLIHRKLRSEKSPREGTAVTDGLFMSSRDGKVFHRRPEAFIRPGLGKHNWVYGDNYQNWGLVLTKSQIEGAPDEISLYATEDYWTGKGSKLRRFTIRVDGFVSVFAPLTGGELLTKPFVFDGNKLLINFSTSAAGSIKFEFQDENGNVISDYSINDCEDIFGDSIEYVVKWKTGTDVSKLKSKTVRLRITLKDADLYSIKFPG